jgi:hypothetical protein
MPTLALWLGSMAAPALADGIKTYDRVVDLGQQQYTYITEFPKIDEAGNLVQIKPSAGSGYEVEGIDPNRSGHILGTTLHKIGDTTNLLPAVISGPNAVPYGLNASGHIVGDLSIPNAVAPFFFAPETGQLAWLKSLPGATGAAKVDGINALDQLVGAQDGKAIFWASPTSVPVELSSLLPTSSKWQLNEATDINDRGEIVGYGDNPAGKFVDFKLEPSAVPEPTTLALLALSGLVVAVCKIRNRR